MVGINEKRVKKRLDRLINFTSDPGLRRGDFTPRVIYGSYGERILAKHWPIVRGISMVWPRGPWTVQFGKMPQTSCDGCGLNMKCLKSTREVGECLLDQEDFSLKITENLP